MHGNERRAKAKKRAIAVLMFMHQRISQRVLSRLKNSMLSLMTMIPRTFLCLIILQKSVCLHFLMRTKVYAWRVQFLQRFLSVVRSHMHGLWTQVHLCMLCCIQNSSLDMKRQFSQSHWVTPMRVILLALVTFLWCFPMACDLSLKIFVTCPI